MPSLVSYFFSCKYWLECSPYNALPKSPSQRWVLWLPPEHNSKAALTTLYYTNYLCNYSLDYKPWQAEAIHLGIPSAWHSTLHMKDSKLPFLTWTNYKIEKKMSLRAEKKNKRSFNLISFLPFIRSQDPQRLKMTCLPDLGCGFWFPYNDTEKMKRHASLST